jgi:hypothetical protein
VCRSVLTPVELAEGGYGLRKAGLHQMQIRPEFCWSGAYSLSPTSDRTSLAVVRFVSSLRRRSYDGFLIFSQDVPRPFALYVPRNHFATTSSNSRESVRNTEPDKRAVATGRKQPAMTAGSAERTTRDLRPCYCSFFNFSKRGSVSSVSTRAQWSYTSPDKRYPPCEATTVEESTSNPGAGRPRSVRPSLEDDRHDVFVDP